MRIILFCLFQAMKLDLDEPEDKISRESDEGSMTSGSISGSTFSGSQILTGSNFSGQILSGTSDSPANGDVSALKRQKQELEIKLREEVSAECRVQCRRN